LGEYEPVRMITLFACAGALAFASPTTAQSDPFPPSCSADHLNPSTLAHLRISRSGPGFDPDRGPVLTESLGNGGKVLGYTRIRAFYQPCSRDQRSYVPEKRNDFTRFFLGKHAKKLLSVQLQITPLDVKTNKQLAAIERDSTKKGEVWNTDVENDGILLPYLRIDQSSVVAIDAKLSSTRDYDSSIGADALDIVQRASSLINPTTALITTENKDRFTEAANFVDVSVNGMLKVSIDEQVHLRVPLKQSLAKQILAIITLQAPRANDVYPSTDYPERILGQWVIYAEPVRQSMFDDVPVGGRINRNTVTSAAILNYLVDDKKTLREALAGVKSLVSARDALVKADKAGAVDSARSLCRTVAAEAQSLGLAPIDAAATAWAYLIDVALSTEKAAEAEKGCSEVELYPR